MAFARWQATITDDAGNVVPAATVEVRNESGGALAPIYSDRAGTISLGNPSAADSAGYFFFHAAGGAYKVTATFGTTTRTWRYVALGTAVETDTPVARVYATRAAAIAATLSSFATGDQIQTMAYATTGDGGGGTYEKVASLGSGTGYFTAADGSFWRLFGQSINILQFGAAADPTAAGVVLSTTPINDAISFINANGKVTTLIFGRGEVYTVNAQLTAFTRNIEIYGTVGTDASPSTLNKRFVEASATRGIFSCGKWMPKIVRLAIIATSGSGGSAIDIINPADTASVGNCYLENLQISTGDFCNYGIYIDGTANTGGGSPPIVPVGARNIFFTQMQVFGAAVASAKLSGIRNVFMTGVTIDTAGGSGLGLWVTGSSGVHSDNIIYQGIIGTSTIQNTDHMVFVGTTGNLTLDTTDNVQFYGEILGSIANASTVTNTRVFGRVTGSVDSNWDYTNIIYSQEGNRSGSTLFKSSVNFTSANTDTEIPIVIPAGYSRYRINAVFVSGANETITTATAAMWTAASAGGTNIVASPTAITVSTASEGAANNMQSMTLAISQNTTSFAVTSLFWRVVTAQAGTTARATVVVSISPVS